VTQLHNQKETILHFAQLLMDNYLKHIYEIVRDDPNLVSVVPGFLISPEELIFYLGRTHLGIEYVGPELIATLPTEATTVNVRWFDFSLSQENFLSQIIGFNYSKTMPALFLPPLSVDLVLPTNSGVDELIRLKWNWSAQDTFVGLNTGGIEAPLGQFTRIINGSFFDSSNSGLRARHIKWLDLVPLTLDEDSDKTWDCITINMSPLRRLASSDAHTPYPIPDDYKFQQLPKINRFVELIGDRTNSERDITSFLELPDNRFILKMRFAATNIHPQLLCEWQSDNKKPIKPDFFAVGTDGFADIVEFKLPEITGSIVVGAGNRETFSAELNSYVSQSRVYRDYFEDPNNRRWVEEKYGFKVFKPRRFLVIGRRWNFDSTEWRQIEADFTDLKILNYDDLIDGVVLQFYQ
jgi:antiviral defense system Shedu protein SduA